MGQADGLSGVSGHLVSRAFDPDALPSLDQVPVRCGMTHPVVLGSARCAVTIHTEAVRQLRGSLSEPPVRPALAEDPLSADARFRQRRGQGETEATTLRTREIADEPRVHATGTEGRPPCQGGRPRKEPVDH
jgi:hypothetical protein